MVWTEHCSDVCVTKRGTFVQQRCANKLLRTVEGRSLRVNHLYALYHVALGPYVPFDGVHPGGSITPLVQCANLGASGCLFLYVAPSLTVPGASFAPR